MGALLNLLLMLSAFWAGGKVLSSGVGLAEAKLKNRWGIKTPEMELEEKRLEQEKIEKGNVREAAKRTASAAAAKELIAALTAIRMQHSAAKGEIAQATTAPIPGGNPNLLLDSPMSTQMILGDIL